LVIYFAGIADQSTGIIEWRVR